MANSSGSSKLSKLKCMIKRWHSSSSRSIARTSTAVSRTSSTQEEDRHRWNSRSFHGADEVPAGLHPVYVGKSRRRYLISSSLIGHPLFRVLVERSSGVPGGSDGAGGGTVVGCEVVLFEHLLWMLENADPQPESLDELVEFYAC